MSELTRYLTKSGSPLADLAAETPPGMAYFVRTGPSGTTCGACRFFGGKKRRSGIGKGDMQPGRCREFIRMMRSKGNMTVPRYELAPDTASCRHFEAIPQEKEKGA